MLGQLRWRSLAGAALQIALLAIVALAFFMRTPQVSGLSMAPDIASGEVVLIDTMAYRFHPPARGQIIAFYHDRETYIKRVIGLPGDRIAIDRGQVILDGKPLAEPYVRFPDGRSFAPVTVPPNSLYVLGDNRAQSDDSRFWGFVPENQVLGKAIAGIWPLERLGAL